PTGNLDSASSEEILSLLTLLNRGEDLTVIVVTHEPDIAAHTQRIIAMLDGLVVRDQPTAEWRAATGVGAKRETPRP
ncbi:MAG: hypothetical protein HY533_06570, partial [Chloroflexi bacterium]|nr:hypothetical protein [Chloroflexota bacterium]